MNNKRKMKKKKRIDQKQRSNKSEIIMVKKGHLFFNQAGNSNIM
jgi:hypothetical protein